ncbi:MAG: sigma-70 family RNA polymerase sigma factor [Pseudomonadota bacterium]
MAIEPVSMAAGLTGQTISDRSDAPSLPEHSSAEEQLDSLLLVRIAQKRDRAAMRELYQRYHLRLRGFLRRLTTDDAVIEETYNDVMLKVWEKADQFRSESKVSSWIFSIAYRLCIRVLKRERRKSSLIDRLRREPNPEPTTASSNLEDEDLVNQALQGLSVRHRIVIELAYFEGYSTEEISHITRCPRGTVKTRLHHARHRIRHAIDQLARAPGVTQTS